MVTLQVIWFVLIICSWVDIRYTQGCHLLLIYDHKWTHRDNTEKGMIACAIRISEEEKWVKCNNCTASSPLNDIVAKNYTFLLTVMFWARRTFKMCTGENVGYFVRKAKASCISLEEDWCILWTIDCQILFGSKQIDGKIFKVHSVTLFRAL